MRAIFREAVEQDFLLKDPARSVKAPSTLRDTDKTTLSWDQLVYIDPSFYSPHHLRRVYALFVACRTPALRPCLRA